MSQALSQEGRGRESSARPGRGPPLWEGGRHTSGAGPVAPRGSEGDQGGVLSKCSVCGCALGCRPQCRRGPFRALNGKLTSPRAASGRVSANRRHWDPGGGVGPERGSRLLEAVASTNLHEVTLWSSRVPTARPRAAPLPDSPRAGDASCLHNRTSTARLRGAAVSSQELPCSAPQHVCHSA